MTYPVSVILLALRLALLGALGAAVHRGKRAVLFYAGFVTPLAGITLSGGLGVTYAAAAAVVLILAALSKPRARIPGAASLILFLAWLGSITLAYWLGSNRVRAAMSAATAYGWGKAQTEWRFPIQFTAWVLLLGAAVAIWRLIQNRRDLDCLTGGYLAGLGVSVIYGLLLAVGQGRGISWFAYDPKVLQTKYHDLLVPNPVYNVGPLRLGRLYGFSGEPKHMAGFILLGLVLLVARTLGRRATARELVYTLLLIVGLLATFSTSGLVAGAVVVAFLTVQGVAHRSGAVTGLVFSGISVAVVFWLVAPGARDAIFKQRISERLSGGLATAQEFEYKDKALWDHLSSRPDDMISGYGAGGADFHLLDEVPPIKLGSAITPTYAVDRVIGESGLLGLALLLSALAAWWATCRHCRSARLFVTGAGLAIVLGTFVTFPAYLLLAAGWAAYASSLERVAPTHSELGARPSSRPRHQPVMQLAAPTDQQRNAASFGARGQS